MKVLTFNVRQWFRDTDKNKPTYWKVRGSQIINLISKENPDIILFQEMMFPMIRYIPKEYKRATKLSISHHIYCRKTFHVARSKWTLRWCFARIFTNGEFVDFYSIHTHWNEKNL